MKRKHVSREALHWCCERVGPEDGIDPRYRTRSEPGRRNGRKALQLCDQVARTLEHVLAWESEDEVLRDLRVEAVLPAPNTGHLRVIVSVSSERDVAEVLERLRRRIGQLRTEVAQAIHRRRAPELSFDVLVRAD